MIKPLSRWDTDLFYTVNGFRTEFFDLIMPVLSYIWLIWFLGVLVFSFWAARVFRRDKVWESLRPVLFGVAFVLGTAGVTDVLVNKVKFDVGRLRPQQSLPHVYFQKQDKWHRTPEVFTPKKPRGDSFISGHAAHSMAVAVTAATLYPPLAPVVYAMPLAVGYSRMYLGKHFPGDVLAGWIAGAGVALLARRLTRGLRRRLMAPEADYSR